MDTQIPIAVVDNLEVVAEGLARWFEAQNLPFQFAWYGNSQLMLDQLKAGAKHEVFVVGYQLRPDNGVIVTREILKFQPDAKVIGFAITPVGDQFMAAGAYRYLSKDVNGLKATLEDLYGLNPA